MGNNEGFYEPCWTEHVPGSVPGKRDECVCGETSSRNCPEHQGDGLDEALDLMRPRHPDSARFHALLEEIGKLHDQKQKDYGRDDDPFANVRASTGWGVDAWVGCMIRANDKIKRLQKLAESGELANEAARDSFLDLAVYSLIGLILFEDEQPY